MSTEIEFMEFTDINGNKFTLGIYESSSEYSLTIDISSEKEGSFENLDLNGLYFNDESIRDDDSKSGSIYSRRGVTKEFLESLIEGLQNNMPIKDYVNKASERVLGEFIDNDGNKFKISIYRSGENIELSIDIESIELSGTLELIDMEMSEPDACDFFVWMYSGDGLTKDVMTESIQNIKNIIDCWF